MHASLIFKMLFLLFLSTTTLSAQDELIEKYLTLADFSITGFKDIKDADRKDLINLPFYLSGFSVAFDDISQPAQMELKVKYDPNKTTSAFDAFSQALYNQKSKPVTSSMIKEYKQIVALKKALSEHHNTTYTEKSNLETKSLGMNFTFYNTKVFLAEQDVAAWESQEYERFHFPVIEIQEATPNGENTTHSITFIQPLQYEGKKDYYSQYSWQPNAKIPEDIATAGKNQLKGQPKMVVTYTVSPEESTFKEYITYAKNGLKTSSKGHSFNEFYLIDTLGVVVYDDDQNIIETKKYSGLIEGEFSSLADLSFSEHQWNSEGDKISWNSNRKTFYTFNLDYDTNGSKRLQRITYKSGGYTEFSYNGPLISEKRRFYEQFNSTDTTTFKYDQRGRMTNEEYPYTNSDVVIQIQYDDQKKQRLYQYSMYNQDKKLTKVNDKLYNHLGYLIQINYDDGKPENRKQVKYSYEYDDQQNWIKRTATDIFKESPTNGEVIEVLIRKITYY
ncbi:MAG: hypothetical protein AAF502_24125 [Bacteroidota bacterium]